MTTKEIIEQLKAAGAEEVTVHPDGRISAKFPQPPVTYPQHIPYEMYPPHYPWVEPFEPARPWPWVTEPVETVPPGIYMYACPTPTVTTSGGTTTSDKIHYRFDKGGFKQ
jgi:hypothetical protein